MDKARVNEVYSTIPEEERIGLEDLAKLILKKPTRWKIRRAVVEYYLMRQLADKKHESEK